MARRPSRGIGARGGIKKKAAMREEDAPADAAEAPY